MHGRVPSLTVSETFGPTFQGEGPSLGRRCGFVRLGRCNLDCAWCDTPYTWDWDGANGTPFDPSVELSRRPVADVLEAVDTMGVRHVVVTGGEPMLQRSGLTRLCQELAARGTGVEIETNGTIAPWPELACSVERFNVGLKLANSGVDARRRLNPVAIEAFVSTTAVFKFVAAAPEDLEEICELSETHRLPPERIWVMPQGTTREAVVSVARTLAEPVLEAGWNLTTRMHTLLWGDSRGC